jgi:hypothetical protein
MTKKTVLLIALAVLLAGASLYINRDWFTPKPIQISHRSLRVLVGNRRPGTPAPIVFLLDRPLRLTSVKVVAVNGLETNKYPHALWELVTDSESMPVKEFVYGNRLEGMEPAIKGTSPGTLEAGMTYRIMIRAGSSKAQHDFTVSPM